MKKFLILIFLFFAANPVLGHYSHYRYSKPQWQTYYYYYDKGIKHFNQNNYNAAISDFTNSIKLNPDRELLYYLYRNRGVAEHNIKEYEKAIYDYSQAISINSKNSDVYICRGDSYIALRRYWAALDDYTTSLKIKKSKEVISKINTLRQNFKKPKFLCTNYKYILQELGYLECIILLICVIILFSNNKKMNITFKEYNRDYVSLIFKDFLKSLNVKSPVPQPEEFKLNRNRIDYIEEIYQQTKKSYFSTEDESGITVLWSIILSLFFMSSFMYKILIMYLNTPNEDWLYAIAIGLPAIIIYHAIKKLPILLKPAPDITLYECQTYLLYKEVLDLYNNRMNQLKKIEKEKQLKIREEEERKLKQQRSYWVKYWSEKQQNGFDFENAVGELYRKLGYEVKVTQGTGDGGVDLILKKNNQTIIAQCKAHKHQVGPNDVRALWGVREDFNANSAIFIAYSGVTQGARDFVRGKKLRIVDVNELIQLSIQVHSEKV